MAYKSGSYISKIKIEYIRHLESERNTLLELIDDMKLEIKRLKQKNNDLKIELAGKTKCD